MEALLSTIIFFVFAFLMGMSWQKEMTKKSSHATNEYGSKENIEALPQKYHSLELGFENDDLEYNDDQLMKESRYLNCAESISEATENPNCELLYLDDQELGFYPEIIFSLNHLKALSLTVNNLTEIPETIGNLKSLEGLYLDFNFIEEIPQSLFNLVNLKELDLEGNELDELPDGFEKLKSLEYLNIQNNYLDDHQIAKIKRLLPECEILY